MKSAGHDIVVFGATSFVGKILSEYLLNYLDCPSDHYNWAIAGRSQTRLEQLKQALGEKARGLPVLVADARDEAALKNLCQQARVVVSTVGPYALYGEALVKACVETGTDYCDLTGETHWVRQMISRYEPQARASGARIVHCCGFDSVPSDMGVYFLQHQALEAFGKPCVRVKMRVRRLKGGVSGGTVASIINVVKAARQSPDLRKVLADPFALCPEGHGFSAMQFNVKSPRYDEDFKAWSAPFIMSGINTRVVHRSNALSGNFYGDYFKYDEAMLTGRGFSGRNKAMLVTAALGALLLGAATAPGRWLLEHGLLPAPGEGPDSQAQARGHYTLDFLGETDTGQRLHTRVCGDRDPGYGSTAKILGQVAACLAFDSNGQDQPGGFWTPSTLLAQALLVRLIEQAGLSFQVLSSEQDND